MTRADPSAARGEENTYVDGDGRRTFERRWLPAGETKAAVAIIHGYAEHSGRYAWMGERLARAGYAVHALDLRGHGLSDGERALVASFREYLDDVAEFLTRVRARAADAPVVLLGHSMGGRIVTLALVTDRPAIAAVVLSGPALDAGGGQRVLAPIFALLGRWFPRLSVVSLPADKVSRDGDIVRRYETDPLIYHGRMKAGLLAAAVRAGQRISRDDQSIAVPMLIQHGGGDQLASPEGSARLHARVASVDKTLKLYDGLYHEIYNEPERDRVLDDLIDWLDERFGLR
jgi:alpha-beta hydrolase superfamily lysophospholipase